MRIEVDQPDINELEDNDVFSWPIWEHEEDKFDWYYDQTELCFIVEGEVTITTEFESITVKAGDFVTLPKGLDCVWDIHSAVKKHYSFE